MVPIVVATGRSFPDSMATDATVAAVAPGPNIASRSKVRVWRASSSWSRPLATPGPSSRSPVSSKALSINCAPPSPVFDTVNDWVSMPRSTGNRNVFAAGRPDNSGSRSAS